MTVFLMHQLCYNMVDREVPMKYNLNTHNYIDLLLVDETKRDVVLILPGGAYRYASEREAGVVATEFSDLFHQAIYYYREDILVYPEINEEALKVINILLKHPHIDKIHLIGFSAGGHFATMIAAKYPEHIEKVVLCYPVITANPRYRHLDSFINLYGKMPSTDELEDVSMEKRIHEQFPPTFVMHTMADLSVPVENSLLMIEGLRANSVYVESHLYPTGRHGISVANKEVCYEDMDEKTFLDTYGYISDWVRLAKLFLRREI